MMTIVLNHVPVMCDQTWTITHNLHADTSRFIMNSAPMAQDGLGVICTAAEPLDLGDVMVKEQLGGSEGLMIGWEWYKA